MSWDVYIDWQGLAQYCKEAPAESSYAGAYTSAFEHALMDEARVMLRG